MSVASRDTHREMILHPLRWPNTILPLVRRQGAYDTAVFCPNAYHISPTEPITIYLANMWMDWRKAPTKTYSDIDALLDDGWVVD